MDLGLLLRADALSSLGAVAGLLVLAAALLYVNFANRANRVFALFLGLRALALLTAFLYFTTLNAGSVGEALFWGRLNPYFVLPLPFVLAYFVSVHPRPRGWFGRSPWGFAALAGGAVALELAYVADHALWGSGTSSAVLVATNGPLFAVVGLMFLAHAVVAFLFARDWALAGRNARTADLVVCLAFTLNVLFDATGTVVRALQGVSTDPSAWLHVPALLLAGAAVATVLRAASASGDAAKQARVRRFLWALPLPVLSNLALPFPVFYGFLLGVWRLVFLGLVTYALLRYRLFDLDLKLKWTLRQSTVAAAFIGVFFVVSEGAQQFFSSQAGFGPYFGIAAAGVLVFALAPLQRAAERLANHALPHAKPLPHLDEEERIAVYRDQVRFAWADGTLGRNERLLLDNLRERLGLTHEVAARAELEVTGALPVAKPPGGSGAQRSRSRGAAAHRGR